MTNRSDSSGTDTHFARVTIGDEAAAQSAADALDGAFDPQDITIALAEVRDKEWALELYFRQAPDEADVRREISAVLGAEVGKHVAFSTIAARDWVAASLADLKPVSTGRFFLHGAHDRARVPPNRISIEIEAALAFGTGHHGTTRGCLLALDDLLKARRPRRILDVGTGTGVLAIAAARTLRRRVLASDIDAEAVRVARANVRANKCGGFVEVVRAAGVAGKRFYQHNRHELILANILLLPLQRMAAPLAELTAPRGQVILSGILPSQANAVLAAYGPQGLRLQRRMDVDGWTTLVLTQRRRHHQRTKGRLPRE